MTTLQRVREEVIRAACLMFGHKSTFYHFSTAKMCRFVCERCHQSVAAQSEFSKKWDGIIK